MKNIDQTVLRTNVPEVFSEDKHVSRSLDLILTEKIPVSLEFFGFLQTSLQLKDLKPTHAKTFSSFNLRKRFQTIDLISISFIVST